MLFLVVDDLRDWVGCLGGFRGPLHTPNIDRLARRGVLFSIAHCASPKCAPSRVATMTGLRPSTSGLYDNDQWWLPNLPGVITIPAHFQANGYRVAGAGKIFPTLNELCALPPIARHDGVSLAPLLHDPQAQWDRPAVIEFLPGNAAVRSERFRYIRYHDGGEELYDHEADPHEWHNLAVGPGLAAIKAQLATSLPATWAAPLPDKAAFAFDPVSYQWQHRQSGATVSGARD